MEFYKDLLLCLFTVKSFLSKVQQRNSTLWLMALWKKVSW